MSDIILRNFKTKDENVVEVCMTYHIIPVTCLEPGFTAKELLEDYMACDGIMEIAVAICDTVTDEMIGAIHAINVGEELLVSYYVTPSRQKQGIATKALELFETFARENTDARWLRLCICNGNIASTKVAKKRKFRRVDANEYATNWKKSLR